MTSLLAPVQALLTPEVQAEGFYPVDQVFGDDLSWLEYRGADAAGILLLSVFHARSLRTIKVDLWRPARLREASRLGAPERAVEQSLVWYYGEHDDPSQVNANVSKLVSACMPSAAGSRRPSPRPEPVQTSERRLEHAHR